MQHRRLGACLRCFPTTLEGQTLSLLRRIPEEASMLWPSTPGAGGGLRSYIVEVWEGCPDKRHIFNLTPHPWKDVEAPESFPWTAAIYASVAASLCLCCCSIAARRELHDTLMILDMKVSEVKWRRWIAFFFI